MYFPTLLRILAKELTADFYIYLIFTRIKLLKSNFLYYNLIGICNLIVLPDSHDPLFILVIVVGTMPKCLILFKPPHKFIFVLKVQNSIPCFFLIDELSVIRWPKLVQHYQFFRSFSILAHLFSICWSAISPKGWTWLSKRCLNDYTGVCWLYFWLFTDALLLKMLLLFFKFCSSFIIFYYSLLLF